jgi:S-formylglutathione hydrolase
MPSIITRMSRPSPLPLCASPFPRRSQPQARRPALPVPGQGTRHAALPLVACLALVACAPRPVAAQSQIVDLTVHSPALEHNLLGDPADQSVSIVLPAAYAQQPQRRFPVLYFLHGYSDPTTRHQAAELFRADLDHLLASPAAEPFLVVLPNGINKYFGSFYANSAATGNWDDYITRDIVAYVDSHYRTLADPAHRVVAGHSMGGYGALTLAFRHPGVFGSVYALSPCCTDLIGDGGPSNPAWRVLGTLQAPGDVPAALRKGEFFVAADAAMDAALAPDPHSPILGDPPFVLDHGALRTDPAAYARIAANMPANMVVPLAANIAQLRGIVIEYGAQDNFSHIVLGAQELAQRLSLAGISSTLDVYQGDHVNHIAERIAGHLLPWVAQQFTALPPGP